MSMVGGIELVSSFVPSPLIPSVYKCRTDRLLKIFCRTEIQNVD